MKTKVQVSEPRAEDLKSKLLHILERGGRKAVSLQDLLRRAAVQTGDEGRLGAALEELCQEGRAVRLKSGRFALPEKVNLRCGTIQGHAEGFAFLIPDDPRQEDLYLSAPGLRPAMHGDRVLATVERNRAGNRSQGRVVKILKRAQSSLLGTYHHSSGAGRLIPVDTRISYHVAVPSGGEGKAKNGDVVEATITKYPTSYSDIEVEVTDVLGPATDPRVDTEVVVRKFGLPTGFPKAVLHQASHLPTRLDLRNIKRRDKLPAIPKQRVAWHQIPLPPAACRLDLRRLQLVTIDGENAKDFDDAVAIVPGESGMNRLIVAIADVAHYAPEGAVLDSEALERGTSVYFPDRVIPMFPERLSNGIASLNPGVNRLVMAVIMDFDQRGNRVSASFHPAIMRSSARLTYTEVRQALVDEEPEVCRKYTHLLENLERMAELAQLLARRRRRRGSIDFDLPEAEILLDVRGRPENIVKAERSIAHRLIEEFMIAANEAVAEYLTALSVPILYRIHEPPDEDVVRRLGRFLEGLGIRFKGSVDSPRPAAFQAALSHATGKAEERLINTVILRSMKQARYAAENLRHFGLASKCYAHFTSPIRRYPDLVVHRQLGLCLEGKRQEAQRRGKQLAAVAEQASQRERTAVEAEREVVQLKKIQFMQDKVGDEYEGFISGVVPFGVFVELSSWFVEGLVHISTLVDDYYDYEEENYCLRGRRRRRVLKLGDKVRVRVASVSIERRQIDFCLVEEGR